MNFQFSWRKIEKQYFSVSRLIKDCAVILQCQAFRLLSNDTNYVDWSINREIALRLKHMGTHTLNQNRPKDKWVGEGEKR
jgi:hypothetical protein